MVQSAKTTKSPKGADILGIVWKVLKCSNETCIGRTIRDSINVKMKPEKIANLFEATGLIQNDVLVLPAGLTPEEALVNRTTEFYTGVNEWQGREYTTVDTDYFPDNNLS